MTDTEMTTVVIDIAEIPDVQARLGAASLLRALEFLGPDPRWRYEIVSATVLRVEASTEGWEFLVQYPMDGVDRSAWSIHPPKKDTISETRTVTDDDGVQRTEYLKCTKSANPMWRDEFEEPQWSRTTWVRFASWIFFCTNCHKVVAFAKAPWYNRLMNNDNKTTDPSTGFHCVGRVRGWCGHTHSTHDDAEQCIADDQDDCSGSRASALVQTYSDRRVFAAGYLPQRDDGPYIPANRF